MAAALGLVIAFGLAWAELFRRLGRRSFRRPRVRYCGPAEYAVRVLAEFAMFGGYVAALEWLLPLPRLHGRHLPAFESWPQTGRLAVVAFFGALVVLDIALLRLRRNGVRS